MRAGAGQHDLFVNDFIYEKPIGFDVTFPKSLPFAFEPMITCALRQRRVCLEQRENEAQFLQIPATFSGML